MQRQTFRSIYTSQTHIFIINKTKLQMWSSLLLQEVHNADIISQQKSTYVQWQHGLVNVSKPEQVTSLLSLLM